MNNKKETLWYATRIDNSLLKKDAEQTRGIFKQIWETSGMEDAWARGLFQKIREQMSQSETELTQTRIAVVQGAKQKELAERELVHRQELAQIEKERAELEAANKKAGKGGLAPEETARFTEAAGRSDERAAQDRYAIEYKYFQQMAELQKQLTDVYLTEEQRRTLSVKEKYDVIRNQVNDKALSGEIGTDELPQLYGAIGKAEGYELIAADLKRYETALQKKERLTQQYNERIAALNAQGYNDVAKQVEKARDEEIVQLELEQTEFYQILFGDLKTQSTAALKQAIQEARRQLENYKTEAGNKNGGILTEQDNLFVKRTETAIAGAENAVKAAAPAIPAGINQISQALAEAAKGAKLFDDALGESIQTASTIAGGVGEIWGSYENLKKASADVKQKKEASDTGKLGFADTVGAVGSFAGAFGTAISSVTKVFSLASAANKRHLEALRKLEVSNLNFQRQYNLLLEQQNMLYAKGTTIFGNDAYGKAKANIESYYNLVGDLNTALKGTAEQQKKVADQNVIDKWLGKNTEAELKSAYAGLADVKVVTGHKKTGLFGWGKGKDVYSSILDVYPKLIDENGAFNKKLAETIINTQKMDETSKSTLQNMITLATTAEAAYGELNSYLSGLFGQLGNGLSDAIVTAFRNGGEAAAEFKGKVSQMIESLVQSMVYSATLAPFLKTASDEMTKIFADQNLGDKEKMAGAMQVMDGVMGGIGLVVGQANDLLDYAQQAGKEHGFDLFKPDAQARQVSSGTTLASASQESISALDGRITLMQSHTLEINENIKLLVPAGQAAAQNTAGIRESMDYLRVSSQGILEQLAGIRENTLHCVRLEAIESDMRLVRTSLDMINTKGITLRK